MKLRNHVVPAALLGALALAAIAPAAFADHGRDRDRDDRWSDSRDSRDSRYDSRDEHDRDRSSYGWDHGGRRGERRSYYYEDPYCGQRSQYISDFKEHYGRAGHAPLVLKIDIRTGDLLARYRYDSRAEEWRTWNREYRDGGRDGHGGYGGGYSRDIYGGGYGGRSVGGSRARCARCEDD